MHWACSDATAAAVLDVFANKGSQVEDAHSAWFLPSELWLLVLQDLTGIALPSAARLWHTALSQVLILKISASHCGESQRQQGRSPAWPRPAESAGLDVWAVLMQKLAAAAADSLFWPPGMPAGQACCC